MLRDVREGVLPATARQSLATSRRAVPAAAPMVGRDALLAQVLGKGIVIVPVALVVGFGLWTGYYQFPGSPLVKLLFSMASLALTVGLAFLWAGLRRRRH